MKLRKANMYNMLYNMLTKISQRYKAKIRKLYKYVLYYYFIKFQIIDTETIIFSLTMKL